MLKIHVHSPKELPGFINKPEVIHGYIKASSTWILCILADEGWSNQKCDIKLLTKWSKHQSCSNQEAKKERINEETQSCPFREPPQRKYQCSKQYAESSTDQHTTWKI